MFFVHSKILGHANMIWNHPCNNAMNHISGKIDFCRPGRKSVSDIARPRVLSVLDSKRFLLKLQKNIGLYPIISNSKNILYLISNSKVKSDKHWSEVPPARDRSQRGDHHDGRLPHFPRRPRKAAGTFSQSGK